MKEYAYIKELFQFINKSPSVFHGVAAIEELLLAAGFSGLSEKEEWKLLPGEKYFVTRNNAAIAAFAVPKKGDGSFRIVAAHGDSPCFKVKENPEIVVEKQYVTLNTEKYGGMIHSTWFDRPLSLAGRVIVNCKGQPQVKLFHSKKDLLVIPSLAIHMDRKVNQGIEYNPQKDLLPLFTQSEKKGSFGGYIAEELGIEVEDILGHDLFLYVREEGKQIGLEGEWILSPRLDDLTCAYGGIQALVEVTNQPIEQGAIPMCVVFDNEEVGSSSRQGADSDFMKNVLDRIQMGLSWEDDYFYQGLYNSFLVSADNAHGVHPNYPEKSDPTNRPYLNGGIVVKYHSGQKYTTDAYTGARIKLWCREAQVKCQTYYNRSDSPGGSTLGNISTTQVSIPAADIGLPQLAMHSAVEMAGSKDLEDMIKLLKVIYKS